MIILHKKVAGLSQSALERFVRQVRLAVGLRGRVNVLVTGSTAVRALNRQFRDLDKATDVLSFPAASAWGRDGKRRGPAGEIAIAGDIAAQNAVRLGHSASQEVKILALHGILHLAGYDHERDNGKMAGKEANLRRAFRLPAALIERAHPARTLPGRRSLPSGRPRSAARGSG